MKRKVMKLRLSPNEETMLLKEEYERRRKLRLQQVREQQKDIALQIRQKVKQRREEQLHQIEESLRAEWQKAQDQKMKALEELYLSSLRAIGEGHRQAKENEPDLETLAKQAEERKQRAEMRHRKALKEQKYQKEKLLREQTRRTEARKHALEVERQRAAKVASLPPPPPHPLEVCIHDAPMITISRTKSREEEAERKIHRGEMLKVKRQNFELKKTPAVKPYSADNFSVTRYHTSKHSVDREVDGEQTDARLAAAEEGKRWEELHRETERERREQLEKAHLRGRDALKKVHLAQDREKLLKELEQMENMDRRRRRQIVAQMPLQVFVPVYKRMEVKEEWQRELESAFEDMYCEDRKIQGNLILQFEPKPLAAPDRSHDNDLDISLEQESACDTQPVSARDSQQKSGQVIEEEVPSKSENHKESKTRQSQSKLALRKLLNKIRSQKEEWTSKCEKEIQSEIEAIESGTIASEETPSCDLEHNSEQQENTVCEAKDSVKILESTVAAENVVLIHPQEQAAKTRMEEERQKWYEQIEKQKQEQLALLKQIEEERARLESDFLKIQMQSRLEKAKKKKEEEQGQLVQSHSVSSTDQQNCGDRSAEVEHEIHKGMEFIEDVEEKAENTSSETRIPRGNSHLQMIHNYQQHLLQQNRLHRQTVEEGRKHLQEYQNKLKQQHLPTSATPLSTVETKSLNSKAASEPLLQRQGMQPSQYQSSKPSHAQEYARSLPVFPGTWCVLEKQPSQKKEEQMHNVYPDRRVQFVGASTLKDEEFHLPCLCPSQEQAVTFEVSNNHVREPPQFQLPLGLVMKEVTAVRTQPDVCIQHVRFGLPTKDSSELSEAVHFKESPEKIFNHQTESEAEESLVKAPLMPATRRSRIIQAVSVDSSTYRQGSAESIIKTSLEQPLHLSEFMTLSHEDSKAQGAVEKFLITKPGDASLLNYSAIVNLRDRVVALSENIQAQQKYVKELQEQLNAQREAILSRQKIHLLQKQDKSKEQMQRQEEALKEFFNKQVKHICTSEETTEAQKPDWINRTDFFQVSGNYQQKNCGRSKFHGSEMISQCTGPSGQTEHPERVVCREQLKRRSSKPPVTKVKLGFDLEQHELSVILEADTPKSCNISFAAESQDSQVSRDSPVPAAQLGEGVITCSGPQFGLNNLEVLSKVVTMNLGSEAFTPIPCDFSSTVSTGSLLTSEMLYANPVDTGKTGNIKLTISGLSFDRTKDGIWREPASHPWESSLPSSLGQRQEDFSGASETRLPSGEMYLSKGSRMQQILGKYVGDLNSYLEDNRHFQALAAELDFPEIERDFPDFHHQLFQPLEPSLDSDTSSSCSQYRVLEDSRELSKTSTFSTKSQDTSVFLEGGISTVNIQRGRLPSSFEKNGPNNVSAEESDKENVTAESALSNHCQDVDPPVDFNAALQRSCDQTPGIKKWGNESCDSSANEYEELSRKVERVNLLCTGGELRNQSLRLLKEQKSVYQLNTTPVTVDETCPLHLLKESASSEELPVEAFVKKYVELPEKSVNVCEANKAEEMESQCNTNRKEPDQVFPEVQKSLRIPRETNLEDSEFHLQAVVQQNGSLQEGHEKHSNPVSRSSCHIPVWDAETGHGITEEPELTLINSDYISIAESDIEHTNQGKIKENKISNPACVDVSQFDVFTKEREVLPLALDTARSACVRPDSSAPGQSPSDSHFPAHQSAVMLFEFVDTYGSLQESFLKRKKNFIQKSLKRVEEIKNKENVKPEAKQLQRLKSDKLSKQKESSISGKKGAVAHQLKKVEVKVSFPEDRKSGKIEMHQRTSRLYNQLAEVKIRKEAKTRQEIYEQNREKAKEFQKRMLEKLRAKTWKAP